MLGDTQDLLVRRLGPPGAAYLTFDDGPNPEVTETLLDLLALRSVKGTFFINGQAVLSCGATVAEKIVRRISEEGHSVGNHGMFHDENPRFELLDEWLAHLGIGTRLIRPPYGRLEFARAYLARHPEAIPYSWNVQFNEWVGPIDWAQATSEVTRMPAGSIMLLHDGVLGNPQNKDRTEIPTAVSKIIALCEQRGLPLAQLPM